MNRFKNVHIKMTLTNVKEVIFTNNSILLFNNINFNRGLSEWHAMRVTAFNENSISNKR